MILPSFTGYAEPTGAIALILEVAFLNVRGGQTEAFEEAFSRAQEIFSEMPGYVWHQLQRCVEEPRKYLLLVQWNRIEDHTIGFRQSRQYQDWKNLLHHFYDPFPTVEHFEVVFKKGDHSQQTR
jgi:heme-degrading monooxygenase HmoA